MQPLGSPRHRLLTAVIGEAVDFHADRGMYTVDNLDVDQLDLEALNTLIGDGLAFLTAPAPDVAPDFFAVEASDAGRILHDSLVVSR